MRRSVKRAVVIVAAMVSFTSANAAYAALTGNGLGSLYAGTAAAGGPAKLEVSATVTGMLYPRAVSDMVVKIRNRNPYPVTVASVSAAGPVTAKGGIGTCVNTGVSFVDQVGSWSVPANGETQLTLRGAVRMSNDSENGCQGAVFRIPLRADGAIA